MIVLNESNFNEAIKQIAKAKLIVLDTETEGLEIWQEHRACGIGVYIPEADQAYYFPFRHKETDMPLFATLNSGRTMLFPGASVDNLEAKLLPKLFKALNKPKTVIGHNLKFDLAVLYQDGFELTEEQQVEDTITAARLYYPGKYDPLGLEAVSDDLLKTNEENWKKEFKDYLKKNKWHNHYDQAPSDVVGEYCINDCKHTYEIRQILLKHIETTGQQKVWEQECKLLKILFKMEKEGLYFDKEYCRVKTEKIKKKLEELAQLIYATVGQEFDISSPKQINEVMNKIGITSPHLTPGGQAKWGVAELLGINHPVSALILEWRGIEKMRSTYFEPLEKWTDSRQHPSFKPWGSITGRMSCSNPSLMNLSNKSQNLAGEEVNQEVLDAIKAMMGARAGQTVDMTGAGGGSFAGLASYAKKYEDSEDFVSVRRLYIPPEGYQFYCMDFSQVEMRVFADYVEDDRLNSFLEDGNNDFHSIVVKEVWKIDEDAPLWKFYRTLAKAVNFGLVYGIGNEKLASQIQQTEVEAAKYKEQYFARFPKAKQFIRQVMDVASERGWIKNRFGRRYTIFPDKTYVGVNYLCQGSAADIMKSRMVDVDEYLKDKQSKMVLQVHDELVFYIKDEEELEVVPKLKAIMEERQIKTFLPVTVSKGLPSWAEKKPVCTEHMKLKSECETLHK